MNAIPTWKLYPLLRLLLPLIGGIVLQHYTQIPLVYLAAFFIIPLGSILISVFFSLQLKKAIGVILMFLFCVLGSILYSLQDPRASPAWYGNYNNTGVQYKVQLTDAPIEKDKSYQAEAKVVAVVDSLGMQKAEGRILIYFEKAEQVLVLDYGSEILINNKLQLITNSGNPGGFNYKQYAFFHQWVHTAYLKKGDWQNLQRKITNPIKSFCIRARNYVTGVFATYFSDDPNVLAIANAMIIGYKVGLDKDLIQSYSNTGIVHIVAISGMHLGMLFLFLQAIFSVIPGKAESLYKVATIIIVLWVFSLITGASASVLRSAIMFTCMLIGKHVFGIKSSSYNGLIISAFILLCYNPYFLWDVGFQMSYLAVFGIVWLQRPIQNLLQVNSMLVFKIWQLTTVTLAAQIITFPLSTYYFHQFPTYFLPVNLLAAPISFVIVIACLLLILTSWLPFISVLISKLAFYGLQLLNKIVTLFDKLPHHVVDQLYLTTLECMLSYGILCCGCNMLLLKKRQWIWPFLIFVFAFSLSYAYRYIKAVGQQKIVVYNMSKYQCIDFIDGKKYEFAGSREFDQNMGMANFYLKPTRLYFGATDTALLTARINDVYAFKDQLLLVADSNYNFAPAKQLAQINVLVLSQGAPKLDKVVQTFSPQWVVIDGTHSLWKTEQYIKQCEALHLRHYSTRQQGAFVYNLP